MNVRYTPEYYAFRADEMRAIADSMTNAAPKAAMMRVAEDYDAMANIAGRMTKDVQSLERKK